MRKKNNEYIPLVPKKEIEQTNFRHTKNRIYIGYATRMMISFIMFFIVLLSSIVVIRESLNIVKINEIKIKETSDLDYKVYLNKNDIYDEEYLNKDLSYITELINLIKIDVKYNFEVNEKSNYNFKYQILGDLIIEDSEKKDNVYVNKTYILSDKIEDIIEHDTKYEIDKTITIDYWYYNGLANKLKEYKQTSKSYLKIYINIIGETLDTNYYSFTNKVKPSIIIPLAEDAIKIEKNNINNTKKVGNKPLTTVRSLPLLALGIVLFLVAILIIAQIILKIKYLFPKKSIYDKTIDKILKEYDDIIINTTTKPDKAKLKVVNVLEFKELLDVYNQVKEPIKYYIINEHNKCEFYINYKKEIYVLTIKAVDLEKNR